MQTDFFYITWPKGSEFLGSFEIFTKFLEIFREFLEIFRAFFKNFSKDI